MRVLVGACGDHHAADLLAAQLFYHFLFLFQTVICAAQEHHIPFFIRVALHAGRQLGIVHISDAGHHQRNNVGSPGF